MEADRRVGGLRVRDTHLCTHVHIYKITRQHLLANCVQEVVLKCSVMTTGAEFIIYSQNDFFFFLSYFF